MFTGSNWQELETFAHNKVAALRQEARQNHQELRNWRGWLAGWLKALALRLDGEPNPREVSYGF